MRLPLAGVLVLAASGCAAIAPAPSLELVCRDPAAAGRALEPFVIEEDGSVTRGGAPLGRVLADRVVDRRGVTHITVAPDGALVTAEGLPWRLTPDGDLVLGGARVTIADDGAVTPDLGLPLACRFEGFAPERRREAALALAGGVYALRGLVAVAVVRGLGETFRLEAAPVLP